MIGILFFYHTSVLLVSKLLIFGGQSCFLYAALSLAKGSPMSNKLSTSMGLIYGCVSFFGITLMSMLSSDLGFEGGLLRIFKMEAITNAPLPFVWLILSFISFAVFCVSGYVLATTKTQDEGSIKSRIITILFAVLALQTINYVYFEYFMSGVSSGETTVLDNSDMGFINTALMAVVAIVDTIINAMSSFCILSGLFNWIRIGWQMISTGPKKASDINLFLSGVLLLSTGSGLMYVILSDDFIGDFTMSL